MIAIHQLWNATLNHIRVSRWQIDTCLQLRNITELIISSISLLECVATMYRLFIDNNELLFSGLTLGELLKQISYIS